MSILEQRLPGALRAMEGNEGGEALASDLTAQLLRKTRTGRPDIPTPQVHDLLREYMPACARVCASACLSAFVLLCWWWVRTEADRSPALYMSRQLYLCFRKLTALLPILLDISDRGMREKRLRMRTV